MTLDDYIAKLIRLRELNGSGDIKVQKMGLQLRRVDAYEPVFGHAKVEPGLEKPMFWEIHQDTEAYKGERVIRI